MRRTLEASNSVLLFTKNTVSVALNQTTERSSKLQNVHCHCEGNHSNQHCTPIHLIILDSPVTGLAPYDKHETNMSLSMKHKESHKKCAKCQMK